MAASDADPQTLKSWNNAFQGPISDTRRLEKQLRAQAATDKDRLRTLVGASYRSLLTTAEQIIQMHQKTEVIDGLVGDVGQKCNSTSLAIVNKELGERSLSRHSQERRIFAAQLMFLDKCSVAVSRLLKRNGSLSMAAKLLTISRLLHKALSQEDSAKGSLGFLRSKISVLRRYLLSRVDRRFASSKTTFEQLLDAMSAFCLATSSSSTDVLKHFQSLRLDAIRRHSSVYIDQSNPSSALQIWIQTLRTTQNLLGRRLPDMFRNLRKQPILSDTELLGLNDLNIGLYQKWIAPEVLNFVPWIKSVELSAAEVSLVLESWSKSAFGRFLEDLEDSLISRHDISELLAVRYDMFREWLPVWKSTPSHSQSDILAKLRSVLNNHLRSQLHRTGRALLHVLEPLRDAIDSQESGRTREKYIWTHDYVISPLDNGAKDFTTELVARYSGQPLVMADILRSLDAWINTMRESRAILEGLRKTRWLDLMEEDDGDDDTLEAVTVNKMLQVQDPDILAEAHDSALAQGLTEFQARLYEHLESKKQTNAHALLRLVRGICQKLTTAFPESDFTPLLSLVPPLHERLVDDVLQTMRNSRITGGKSLNGQYLWDGQPRLPVLPSPRTFKFLRLLMETMAHRGEDLWVVPAVDILKTKIWNAVLKDDLLHVKHDVRTVESHRSYNDHGMQNGEVLPNGTSQGGQDSVHQVGTSFNLESDREAQNLFDVLFLHAALSKQQTSHSSLDDLLGTLDVVGSAEEGSVERLNDNAIAYWDRSKLLFGPLTT